VTDYLNLSPAELTVSEVANNFPVLHEIGKRYYHFQKSPPLVPMLNQMNSSTLLQLVSVRSV